MPSETYSTIEYVGLNGGTRVSGTFVEVDALHWVENGIFRFQELYEDEDRFVYLFDASRNLSAQFNLETKTLKLQFGSNVINWEIVGFSTSLSPISAGDNQLITDATSGQDRIVGKTGVQDIFVFDSRETTGVDKISKFGQSDIFVTTTKLFDSNNGDIITFGKNKVLDFLDGVGTVQFLSEAGGKMNALEYDGLISHDGTDYYVYSSAGSAAGLADLTFG